MGPQKQKHETHTQTHTRAHAHAHAHGSRSRARKIPAAMGGSVVYIKSEEQFNTIIKEGKPVIIDFTATWCGPCQRIAPFFEELSAKYPTVTFIKVDVDEMDQISAMCGVRCMPTFLVYKDGKPTAGKLEGASPDALEGLV